VGDGIGMNVERFSGGYVAIHKEDEIYLLDRNGLKYSLSPHIKPPATVFTSESGIFFYSDDDFFESKSRKDHKIGYFTIISKEVEPNAR
jgi:hypothetical protein